MEIWKEIEALHFEQSRAISSETAQSDASLIEELDAHKPNIIIIFCHQDNCFGRRKIHANFYPVDYVLNMTTPRQFPIKSYA